MILTTFMAQELTTVSCSTEKLPLLRRMAKTLGKDHYEVVDLALDTLFDANRKRIVRIERDQQEEK